MNLSIIVAISENNVIGLDSALPWHIPNDLKHFAKLTKNKKVILGHKTYKSILKKLGHPLKGRVSIVLSKKKKLSKFKSVIFVDSWEKALELVHKEKEAFVAGGSQIYEQAFPYVNKLYITRIHNTFKGNAFFPKYSQKDWNLTLEEKHLDQGHTFLEFDRKKSDKSYVHLKHARNISQLNVMENIQIAGECPFCLENLSKYHKKEIIKDARYWVLTHNQWPYDHTKLHLLLISKDHVEKLSDLDSEAGKELFELVSWIERKFDIDFGGLAMRFGDVSLVGGSVNHLHIHIIQPDITSEDYKKVRFKIG